MSPSLWLLIIGALAQLVGVIGYFFNREKAPLPWWIPALVLIGWVLLVIGIFYVYGDYSKVQNLPGAAVLQRLLPNQ
jgi:F0F1-type ATP synthase assembly protein I